MPRHACLSALYTQGGLLLRFIIGPSACASKRRMAFTGGRRPYHLVARATRADEQTTTGPAADQPAQWYRIDSQSVPLDPRNDSTSGRKGAAPRTCWLRMSASASTCVTAACDALVVRKRTTSWRCKRRSAAAISCNTFLGRWPRTIEALATGVLDHRSDALRGKSPGPPQRAWFVHSTGKNRDDFYTFCDAIRLTVRTLSLKPGRGAYDWMCGSGG